MRNDMTDSLVRSNSQILASSQDLPLTPIPIRPRASTKNCCPTYRRLQTVNAFVLLLSAFMIAWHLKDLIVDHLDRKSSNYLGLGAGGLYFCLGLYACWYSYQMQKKALAEEARTLLEVDDDDQVRISVSDSKMNVFAGCPPSPVSDNKTNDKNINMGHG